MSGRCLACNRPIRHANVLEDMCNKCGRIASLPFSEYIRDSDYEHYNLTESIPDENGSKYFYEWYDNA